MVNEFSKKFDMDPLWNKIMLRKHFVIECINNMLKNTAKLVHSRHSPINNFLMNLVAAATVKLEVQLLHLPPPPLERSGKGGGGRCKLGFWSSGNTK